MSKNRVSEKRGLGQASKPSVSQIATTKSKKIAVKNVNHPGDAKRVDAHMYHAMKRAFLKSLPKKSPGLAWRRFKSG